MRTFGLLGKSLEHSFSAGYFNEKFYKEGVDAEYLSFEIENNKSNIYSNFFVFNG